MRFLWTLGAAILVLGGFGIAAVGALLGLPILLLDAALGFSLKQGLTALAYASPLSPPIGAGMGMVVTSDLVKGIRAKAAE